MMLDSQRLMDRWKKGDQNAAQKLYDLHRERLFRLAYGLLGNVQDAEEVAQDALTYALINIDRYQEERAQFSTWLHTITVSRVRDRQRRHRPNQVSLSDWNPYEAEIVSTDPSPEQSSQLNMERRTIWQAINQLPDNLREAIVLRYWGEYSFKEMSEILDCPLGTAQSRVRRGFEKLREQLHLSQFVELGEEFQ